MTDGEIVDRVSFSDLYPKWELAGRDDVRMMIMKAIGLVAERDAVIAEISKVDREIGREIAAAVQRTVTLSGALGGLEGLSSPID